MMLWSQILPATLVFAEDMPPADPPTEVVVPPVEPTPEPVQEAQTAPENTSSEGEEGADGENGTPIEEEAQPGENGDNGSDAENGLPAENGENGENGDSATEENVSDGEPTVIDTGDASSGAAGTTQANTTTTTVPGSSGGGTDDSTVETDNDLALEAAGESEATTGENVGDDVDGVYVRTGDSEAFAYLISLFNIAITNSTGSILFLRNPVGDALNFTQRIMNIFANLTGENGECSFVACTLADAILNIFTDSAAEITNSLVVRSGTGANTATSEDGAAVIDTGNANAFGSIVNFGNLQIIDSRYLVILMTNVGDLAGNIILPEPEFFKQLSSGAALARGSDATFSNTADITNNGTTTAETGLNAAAGEQVAIVDSGDARATSADMNFVNQIGSPICFIVNVGGEWNGDIYQLPEGFTREETTFGEVICGRGGAEDRAATQVNATTTNYAKILNEAIVEAMTGVNTAEGMVAAIRTGDADAFLQILNVVNQTIIGQDWIFALFTVSGDWDGHLVFGTLPNPTPADQLASQLISGSVGPAFGGPSGGYTSNPKFEITKTASVNTAVSPAVVDYTVTMKNVGEGIAYRAKLTDTLKAPSGAVVYERTWNLDSIAMGEEITLSYTVEYNEDIPLGVYTNEAKVTAFRNSSIYVYPNFMTPAVASEEVEIVAEAETVALAPAEQCMPLLKSYMKLGAANNENDVMKLQQFLRNIENEEVDENGIYDSITIAAVKRFQAKYSSEILAPWGIPEPTGNVYYTTQRKINDLACVNGETFALTFEQQQEISDYRDGYNAAPESYSPVSDGIGNVAPAVDENPYTIAPIPGGARVLLKDLAPKDAKDSVSQSHNPYQSFSWLKMFVPFVEALEI